MIVGDRGGLVCGKPGQWRAVDAKVDFDLLGVAHFGEETFVCSPREILRLVGGRLEPETRFAARRAPTSCRSFIVGRDSLFCRGERALFRFDGERWASVL
ncbi:MAG: hypothetical protein QM765_36495 [Myxococcales bacterium]